MRAVTYNIKVLKDTPFDKRHTILSIEDFRKKYTYLINAHNTDSFLISYLQVGRKNDSLDVDLTEWFEVIELTNTFEIGDWVWHEDLKKAFKAVDVLESKAFQPDFASIDAINSYTNVWKRLAKEEEITYWKLHPFCDGTILVGLSDCYFYKNTWRKLLNVPYNIQKYIAHQKLNKEVFVMQSASSEIEVNYPCTPNGLKVGCVEVSHSDIIKMAGILNLK